MGKASKEEDGKREPFGPFHLHFLWVLHVLICLTLGGWMTHLYIHTSPNVRVYSARSFPLTYLNAARVSSIARD